MQSAPEHRAAILPPSYRSRYGFERALKQRGVWIVLTDCKGSQGWIIINTPTFVVSTWRGGASSRQMLRRHVARTVAARFTEKTSPRSLRGSWLAEISAPTLRVSILLMNNRKFAWCVLAFHDQLPSMWLQQKQGVGRCKLPVKRPRRRQRKWLPEVSVDAFLSVLDNVLYMLENTERHWAGFIVENMFLCLSWQTHPAF